QYTLELLSSAPAPLLCLFPQGELLPWHLRPLRFQRGLQWVLSRSETPVTLLPLAIRAELGGFQKAEIYLQFGETQLVSSGQPINLQRMEAELTHLLDQLRENQISSRQGRVLMDGFSATDEKFSHFRQLIRGTQP
ncbi:MAG: hypothetical protein WAN36_15640, partial [Calditrichia bacterium]